MTRKIYGINGGERIAFTDGGWNGGPIHDLGTVAGRQFFSMDEETVASLPVQPEGSGFAQATADELKALKAASPVVRTLGDGIVAAIRAKYSVDDELRALRLNDTAVLSDIGAIVEQGKASIAALGF